MQADKWNLSLEEDIRTMREKIKIVINQENQSWAKLANEAGLDRSNMKVSIERGAALLNKFLNMMDYEVEFKKKLK